MYTLFTDGSCYPNPGGPYGWSCILERDGHPVCRSSGSGPRGTSARAELLAAVHGLEEVPEGGEVVLVSDSQYLTRGLSEWLDDWRRHAFAGIANADLWRELDALAQARHVTTSWVRGHSGVDRNEECDRMAGRARQKAAAGLARGC